MEITSREIIILVVVNFGLAVLMLWLLYKEANVINTILAKAKTQGEILDLLDKRLRDVEQWIRVLEN